MSKDRLEAFSDGVLAIIITIMVLELHIPQGNDFAALRPLAPKFLSYLLSFVFVGIYWNNHHHLLHAVQQVNGKALWANMHLLFWLSLIPFVTSWMGENEVSSLPVALYGVVLLLSGVAFYILVHGLISLHGEDSSLAVAIGDDFKGKISLVIYAMAIPLSFINIWIAIGLYVLVAVMWIVPDPRIEKVIEKDRL
jgi:TMEM175 potassium channel family protein